MPLLCPSASASEVGKRLYLPLREETRKRTALTLLAVATVGLSSDTLDLFKALSVPACLSRKARVRRRHSVAVDDLLMPVDEKQKSWAKHIECNKTLVFQHFMDAMVYCHAPPDARN